MAPTVHKHAYQHNMNKWILSIRNSVHRMGIVFYPHRTCCTQLEKRKKKTRKNREGKKRKEKKRKRKICIKIRFELNSIEFAVTIWKYRMHYCPLLSTLYLPIVHITNHICIVKVYSFIHKEGDNVFHWFNFTTNSQQSNLFGVKEIHEIAR